MPATVHTTVPTPSRPIAPMYGWKSVGDARVDHTAYSTSSRPTLKPLTFRGMTVVGTKVCAPDGASRCSVPSAQSQNTFPIESTPWALYDEPRPVGHIAELVKSVVTLPANVTRRSPCES